MAGSNEFLWKPQSERGGLVILTPASFTGNVSGVRVVGPDGNTIATGNFSGVHNQNREHFRFNQTGNRFPPGSTVQVDFRDNRSMQVRIDNTGSRFAQNFNGYEPAGNPHQGSGQVQFSGSGSGGGSSSSSSPDSDGTIPAPQSPNIGRRPKPHEIRTALAMGMDPQEYVDQLEAERFESENDYPEEGDADSATAPPSIYDAPGTNVQSEAGFGVRLPTNYPYQMIPLPYADFGQSVGDAYMQADLNRDIYGRNFSDARDFALDAIQTDLAGTQMGIDHFLPQSVALGDLDTQANIDRAGRIDSFNKERIPGFNAINQEAFEGAVDSTGMDARRRYSDTLDRVEARATGGIMDELIASADLERASANRGADLLRGSGISSISGSGGRAIDRFQAQERLGLAMQDINAKINADQQLPNMIAGGQSLFTPPTMYSEPTAVPLNPSDMQQRVPLGPNFSAGGMQQQVGSQMTSLQTIDPTAMLSASFGAQQWNEAARFEGELQIGDRIQGQMTALDNAIQGGMNADMASQMRDDQLQFLQSGFGIRQRSDTMTGLGQGLGMLQAGANLWNTVSGSGGGGGQQGGGASGGGGGGGQQGPSIWDQVVDTANGWFGGGSSSSGGTSAIHPDMSGGASGGYYEPGGPPPTAKVAGSGGSGVAPVSGSKMASTQPMSSGGGGGAQISSVGELGPQVIGEGSVPAPSGGGGGVRISAPQSITTPQGGAGGGSAASRNPTLGEMVSGRPDIRLGQQTASAADVGASYTAVRDYWDNRGVDSLEDPVFEGMRIVGRDGDQTVLENGKKVATSELPLESRGLSGPFKAAAEPIPDPATDRQAIQESQSLLSTWNNQSSIERGQGAGLASVNALAARGTFSRNEANTYRRGIQALSTLGNPNATPIDQVSAVGHLGAELSGSTYTGSIDAPTSIGGQNVIGQGLNAEGNREFWLQDGSTVDQATLMNTSNTLSGLQVAQILSSRADNDVKLRALTSVGIRGAAANDLISEVNAGNGLAGLSVINTAMSWDQMNNVQRATSLMQTGHSVYSAAVTSGAISSSASASAGGAAGSGAAGSAGATAAGTSWAGVASGGVGIAGGVYSAYQVNRAATDAPRSQAAGIAVPGMAASGAAIGAGVGVSAVAMGATAGATAGSSVPVIGTIVGAVVGAAIGFGIAATGSGKGKGQKMRDSWRNYMQSTGIVNDSHEVTLADGSTYNIGVDGDNKLDNHGVNIDGNEERRTRDVDWSNPLSHESVPYAHLFAIATGLDPTKNEGMGLFQAATGQSLNAAMSNAETLDDVKANFQAMMGDKVDPNELIGRLEVMRLTNSVTEHEFEVYVNKMNEVMGTDFQVMPASQVRDEFRRSLEAIPKSERTDYHRQLYRDIMYQEKQEESRGRLDERRGREEERRGRIEAETGIMRA